jgi:hypothetical protein
MSFAFVVYSESARENQGLNGRWRRKTLTIHQKKGGWQKSKIDRSLMSPTSKRSSRISGSSVILIGGMNRSRHDCQNGVNGKSLRHHIRHPKAGQPPRTLHRCGSEKLIRLKRS